MVRPQGKLIQHVVMPIGLLVLVSMLVVVGFVWFSARNQDQIALENSTMSVSNALDRSLDRVGVVAKDYSWWNDAVANLDQAFDAEWAHTNVGYYPYDVHGFEVSLVIDRHGGTSYAQIDGEPVEASARELFPRDLDVLVTRARVAPLDEPQAAAGVLEFDGGLALVAVSAVTPEDTSINLPEGPRVVIVYAKRLDQELLDKIADPLPLTELRLVEDALPASGGVLPLLSPGQRVLGQLAWQPHQPGRQFLGSIAPALAVAIGVLLGFTYAVLRHIRETTGAIEASEARFRDVADASSDWIWETDDGLRLTFLSERFATIIGTSPQFCLGRPLADLFHAGEDEHRWRQYQDDLEHRRAFRNVISLCEDARGLTRTVRVSGKPVVDARDGLLGYRGTATDITAEIEAGRRAQYLALHDSLTELPNRELLRERLEQAVASVSRRGDMAALLLLDLDRFKEVNDTLGHPAGDLLLKQCADRLTACVREVDTVARIGGDEFAIVQLGIKEPGEAQLLSRRLLEIFREPIEFDGHEALVTVSIGVALVPTDGSLPQKLLQHADIALYRAKEDGRNAVRFFEPEMDARLQARKVLERELRLAIVRDELELYYQPKYCLRDNRLSGVEALVRWNHPRRGLVPPIEFISVAEETGLILQLGEWVIRTACRQAVGWHGVQVSVNVSPAQFRQSNLVDIVRSAIEDAGMEPAQLELEVTENVLIQQTDAAAKLLGELKSLGVHVAMDDFGTGYSSLSYLQRFPFDKIKVDRSFIRSLGTESAAGAIVRAVISLAGSLGMVTCAEGVETEQQAQILRMEGCDEVQGFLFGRPVPAREFERLHTPPVRQVPARPHPAQPQPLLAG